MPNKAAERAASNLDQFRQHNLGWLLLQISDDFFRFVGPQLVGRGHTRMRTQHATVLTLLPLEGARITELARAAGITKQAMALTVAELEKLGYLERAPDPNDGRAKILRLSPTGLELLRDAQEAVAGAWKRYAEMVGERQLQSLRKGLDGLLGAIEKSGEATPGDEARGTGARSRERPIKEIE